MAKLTDRITLVTAPLTFLLGAMLFGVTATYTYSQLTSVAIAGCVDLPCDAEDPDDCGTTCHCTDALARCQAE